MTVYPLVLHLGPIEITGYGIMMMVGFLMAGWVIQRELRERRLNEGYAADVVLAAVIGGILGAKLWYVALNGGPLLSRGGLVWYGGFVGGTAAVLLQGAWRRVPTRLTLELSAPALALGYALGRVGCFLVQDDYGVPTSVPWGMRFPEGLPPTTASNLATHFGAELPAGTSPGAILAVHPTQLYEVAAMLLVFALLWRLRHHRCGVGWLFGIYLVLAGTERFLVEFLRAKDDRLLGPFSLAQGASVAALALGAVLMARWSRPVEVAIPKEAAVANRAATTGEGGKTVGR
jgi:phosphatidylglycerol:prolipoprotein diacylglycerol transferase